MFTKRVVVETGGKNSTSHYKFNIKDPVLCTSKDYNVGEAIVLDRYNVSGGNFYKIRNMQTGNVKVCKERELINR
jgi:hypothetical protein